MASDIPAQFRFEELLTHTFPGFFSSITLFMLLDIWSPLDLTSWAIRDISNLVSFIGFVIIFGTILGVIIDGIHHSFIEEIIFEKFLALKKIDELENALYPIEELSFPYFLKAMNDKAIDIYEFISKSQYRYSEFYANTFISLVILSLIAPFYLFNVLLIPYYFSIIFFVLSLIIAVCCLKNSYSALIDFERWKFSAICGYLGYDQYIDISRIPEEKIQIGKEASLNARIVDKKLNYRTEEGTKIVFRTNFGSLYSDSERKNNSAKIIVKTDNTGTAKAILTSKKPGVAIVTASSYKCLPKMASVEFK